MVKYNCFTMSVNTDETIDAVCINDPLFDDGYDKDDDIWFGDLPKGTISFRPYDEYDYPQPGNCDGECWNCPNDDCPNAPWNDD